MKAFWVQINGQDLFFTYLKGRCHGNQFCEKKLQTPHFRRSGIQKGMGYHCLNVCINSANNASISCENFVKFSPVTGELTELICERRVRHGKKNWRISSNISRYTEPILAIFSPYESTLGADEGSVPYFPIWQGTLPLQPNNIERNEKVWRRTDAFFAPAFENELDIPLSNLYVRINSGDDQAINLVGFWPVPPEFNCVEQVSISDMVSISTFARC